MSQDEPAIELLTTSGCHLCEQAHSMLEYLATQRPLGVVITDIALDDQLVETYGIRIPVLRDARGGELGWPFDYEALVAFADAAPPSGDG